MAGTPARQAVNPVGPSGRVPWSSRLLHEWLDMRYPTSLPLYELRLGPTAAHLVNVSVTPALEAMLRVNNWYADAVVITPSENLVIEAKMKPDPGAIGQVKFYYRLLGRTPILNQYNRAPWVKVVLFAEDDDDVNAFAQDEGVRVELWTPAWVESYLNQVQFRNRSTAPQIATGG